MPRWYKRWEIWSRIISASMAVSQVALVVLAIATIVFTAIPSKIIRSLEDEKSQLTQQIRSLGEERAAATNEVEALREEVRAQEIDIRTLVFQRLFITAQNGLSFWRKIGFENNPSRSKNGSQEPTKTEVLKEFGLPPLSAKTIGDLFQGFEDAAVLKRLPDRFKKRDFATIRRVLSQNKRDTEVSVKDPFAEKSLGILILKLYDALDIVHPFTELIEGVSNRLESGRPD